MSKWIAAVLNFFLPGLGYIVFGHKRFLGIFWLVGVIGLTYVELGIKTAAPDYYWPMFVSVFIMNIAFAVDVFTALKAREQGAPAPA